MEKERLNRGVVWGNLLKSGVFALVALGFLVGNFFYEGGFAVDLPQVEAVDDLMGSRIIVRFEGAEASLAQRAEEEAYVFDLKEGRVWANLTAATEDVKFEVAGKLLVEANRAVFDLNYVDGKVDIDVYDGDLYLSFLGDASNASPVYSKEVLNTMLLPRASSLRISLRKVDERIGPLLTGKLKKEFFYAAIDEAARDGFVEDNLAKDRRFFDSLKRDFRSEVVRNEPKVRAGVLDRALGFAAGQLTFVPERKRELVLDSLAEHLDKALFYASTGDSVKMKSEVLAFKSADFHSEDLRGMLLSYLDRLAIFNVGDAEYPVYLALLEASDLKGQADLLRIYWFNVYKGVDEGAGAAQKALDLYLEKFDRLLSKDDVNYQKYLIEQNQLFDNLFLRFPLFYRDGYFGLKERIENELLGFYDGQLGEELRQSFVDQKIDFLKRLRRYFFDGEVEVVEAKRIFKRLMNGAKALLPQEEGSVAVIALFEAELSDIEDFWGYLNSPDYQTKFYGSTHDERYAAYLKEREQVFDFGDLQSGVFGEVVEEEVSAEGLAENVLAILSGKAEVSDLKLKDGDLKGRYLGFSAVVGGYPFEALFDRNTELLSEVFVYGEGVTTRPIPAEKLFEVIAQKFGDLSEDGSVVAPEEVTVESIAQRRARLYVAEVLGKLGFEIGIDDVSLVSADEAVYRVSEVFMKDSNEKVRASFEVLMNGEKVRGLFMTVSGEPQFLEGEFTFEELALILEAEREFVESGEEYDAEVLLGRKEEGKVRR